MILFYNFTNALIRARTINQSERLKSSSDLVFIRFVGIHWIALAEYSQMSIPMCQDFIYFQVFCIIVCRPN